jgi:hypothetical protein
MSLQKALDKLTHAKLALILSATITIILIHPLFLPMAVSNIGRDFYNQIQTLKPGDAVILGAALSSGGFDTDRTFYKALLNSIAAKGAKFVIWSLDPTFAALIGRNPSEDVIAGYCRFTKLYNYKYGEDYAYLPYIPGEETAIAAVAANIKATFGVDGYGTPISQIPLFQKVNTLTDFKLAIFGAVSYTVPEMFVRQWPAKYGVTTISYSLFSLIGAYYGKYIMGDLDSYTGFAEYEYMVKEPGEYVLRMDIRNVNVTLTFILIAIGNIAMLQARRKKMEATPSGAV